MCAPSSFRSSIERQDAPGQTRQGGGSNTGPEAKVKTHKGRPRLCGVTASLRRHGQSGRHAIKRYEPKWKKKARQKWHSIRNSHVIPQRTTTRTQTSLSSVIGRERELSGWYDRAMPCRAFTYYIYLQQPSAGTQRSLRSPSLCHRPVPVILSMRGVSKEAGVAFPRALAGCRQQQAGQGRPTRPEATTSHCALTASPRSIGAYAGLSIDRREVSGSDTAGRPHGEVAEVPRPASARPEALRGCRGQWLTSPCFRAGHLGLCAEKAGGRVRSPDRCGEATCWVWPRLDPP